MVQERDNNEEELDLGAPIVTEEPEQEVELDGVTPQTLGEAEEETPHQTDLQAVLKYLHPKYKDKRVNELLQSAMSSRIFPDNFLDKNYLLVMSLMEEHEGDLDIDVVGIISMVQDATSIGYEGRGRVEDLEVAGVAHEQEMEQLSKELGLG
jgi:hypothetical protein